MRKIRQRERETLRLGVPRECCFLVGLQSEARLRSIWRLFFLAHAEHLSQSLLSVGSLQHDFLALISVKNTLTMLAMLADTGNTRTMWRLPQALRIVAKDCGGYMAKAIALTLLTYDEAAV